MPASKSLDIPEIRSTADFARYVGLARATVSKVLNGHPGVKQKNIERIRRAMEETGFTPNAFAAQLRGKRGASVGICMENLLTAPIVSKLAALQKRLRDRDFSSLIEVIEPGQSRQVLQHFFSMQVNAVVFIGHFAPVELSERLEELRKRRIPHVLLDQRVDGGSPAVTLDRVSAMEQVMDHLLDLGHRTFGLLGISGSPQSVQDRRDGITRALRRRKLDPAVCTRSLDYLEPRITDFSFGRKLIGHFLRLKDRPTAFVALNDEIGIGAKHELQEQGIRVPEDASVVGFNNQQICEMTKPNLSSVDQQLRLTVETAAELLFAEIGGDNGEPKVHYIPPVFVLRGSTGPVPRARD